MSAYKHLEQHSVEAEKAWLCRIASNKCIDYLRAADRRVVPTEDEKMHCRELPDREEQEPLRQVLNREMLEELQVCCNALLPPYRDVAIAYFLEGKTAKEIAAMSQTGINTVKTHIRRAREMLKKTYRKELLRE